MERHEIRTEMRQHEIGMEMKQHEIETEMEQHEIRTEMDAETENEGERPALEMLYTPGANILAKMGIRLHGFAGQPKLREQLLCRLALEEGHVQKNISYQTAGFEGLGLLRLNSGSLSFTALPGGENVSLAERGLLLFNGQVPHKLTAGSASEYQILYFHGGNCSYFQERLLGKTDFFRTKSRLEFPSDLSLLYDKAETDELIIHLLLTRLLTQLILEEQPTKERVPAYLVEIKTELETQYYRKHSLDGLEEKYHVNKYRICREFQQYFHSSPLQYLHLMRIRTARDLLKETDMKIHEISYEVGYESTNHFIHHFRKLTGKTPAQYRQLSQNL